MANMQDHWGRDTRASRLDQFEQTAPSPLMTSMGKDFYAPRPMRAQSDVNIAAGLARIAALALLALLAGFVAWLVFG